MFGAGPMDIDAIRQRIDQITAFVPEGLSRTDIVTYCMINYLAGTRDMLADEDGTVPWLELTDAATRAEIVDAFSAQIGQLVATTSAYGPGGWRGAGSTPNRSDDHGDSA